MSVGYDFKGKRVTILGGTGTLGRALTQWILASNPSVDITILSRDEHKQAEMRRRFPKCRYVIGDIRNPVSIQHAMNNRDVVFHVAALKHIGVCEANPIECVLTDTLATETVARAAMAGNVRHLVFSSTDKAVDPVAAYGHAKALSEKILFNYNRQGSATKFSVYRWGNVLGSQGSVIPVFQETLRNENRAYITDMNMTRFWLHIEWAVLYMLRTFDQANQDRAMVPPNMKSAKVIDIVHAIATLMDITQYELIETPMPERGIEKIHEAMYSQHAMCRHKDEPYLTSETCEHYSMAELLDLLAPIVGDQRKIAA